MAKWREQAEKNQYGFRSIKKYLIAGGISESVLEKKRKKCLQSFDTEAKCEFMPFGKMGFL